MRVTKTAAEKTAVIMRSPISAGLRESGRPQPELLIISHGS